MLKHRLTLIVIIIIAASGKIENGLTNAFWPIGIREKDKTCSSFDCETSM